MSINWEWKNKIGELKVRREFCDGAEEFNIAIYKGNADLIFIYEFNDDGVDKYTLYNFFCDLSHFKRCIGDSELFNEWKEITFYESNVKTSDFAREFFKLGIKVTFDPNYKIIKKSLNGK